MARALTGETAGELLCSMLARRRAYFVKLAKRRGIDLSTLKTRSKPIPPMPTIDRVEPFAQP